MSSSRIIFRQHPDSTSEEACELRARIWRYIFDCHAKKATRPSNLHEAKGPKPDDIVKAKGDKHDLTNNQTMETKPHKNMKGRKHK